MQYQHVDRKCINHNNNHNKNYNEDIGGEMR